MTDALDDRLARANPVPEETLGAVRPAAAAALIASITGGRAAPARRPRLLVAGLVALAVAAPVALAAARTSLFDFALGGPAPTDARSVLDRMLPLRYAPNEGPPQSITRDDIVRGSERLVDATRTSSGGLARMYAVRLRGGGNCWYTTGRPFNGGGCGKALAGPAVIGGVGMDTQGLGARPAGTFGQGETLSGPVGARGAVALRIHYRDGTSGTVPVHDGWVMYEVPLAHTYRSHEPTRVDVLDASGRVLAHRDDPFSLHRPAQPRIEQPTRPHTVIVRRPLGWRSASVELLFARGNEGHECIQARNTARLRWTERWLCDAAVGRDAAITIQRPLPPALPISLSKGGYTHSGSPDGYAYYWGWAGAAVARVELRFQDSTSITLPLTRRFFLYVVPSVNWVTGRRPSYLIGRNAAGAVVYRRFLYPAAHCAYPGPDPKCRTVTSQQG